MNENTTTKKAQVSSQADLNLSETLTLPVGIVIDNHVHRKMTVRTLTTAEAYVSLAAAEPEYLTTIVETAAATMVDELNRPLSYDELSNAARQDSYAIEAALGMLEKKQREHAHTHA